MAKKSASDSKKAPAVGRPFDVAPFDYFDFAQYKQAQCKQDRFRGNDRE
jgi:hypothetical protein